MNGNAGPKIEIFAPFEKAFDLTKRILFQPFDLGKWMTIGFAAFLAGLADGSHGGGGFNPGGNWHSHDRSPKVNWSTIHDQIPGWVTGGVIVSVVALIVALVILFMWIGSRGRFMFIDCIVKNRGAIVEPWHEFRHEGNGLFLFKLAVGFVFLGLWTLLALPLLIPLLSHEEFPHFGAALIIFLAMAVLFLFSVSILWAAILWFMVPIMYRQRRGPVAACQQVLHLIATYPGPFILYVLFVIVLIIAGMIGSCVLTCLTCCLAAIPYIGTVILLPLYVFYYSYTLLFLRQFGPEYDAWGNISGLTQPVPPPLSAT